MKTAKEWRAIWLKKATESISTMTEAEFEAMAIEHDRLVQEDAVKHGMTLAIEQVQRRSDGSPGHSSGRADIVRRILQLRDNFKLP